MWGDIIALLQKSNIPDKNPTLIVSCLLKNTRNRNLLSSNKQGFFVELKYSFYSLDIAIESFFIMCIRYAFDGSGWLFKLSSIM